MKKRKKNEEDNRYSIKFFSDFSQLSYIKVLSFKEKQKEDE